MPQEQGQLAPAAPTGFDEDLDASDENPTLPTLELDPARLESKESRRQTLSRLDHLLEQLELANLAELPTAPGRVVHALTEHGLPNPRSYTILELIEIVLNSQGPLMKANRSGSRTLYLETDEDAPRRGFSRWDSHARWGATGS
jgi:hypothetical protein